MAHVQLLKKRRSDMVIHWALEDVFKRVAEKARLDSTPEIQEKIGKDTFFAQSDKAWMMLLSCQKYYGSIAGAKVACSDQFNDSFNVEESAGRSAFIREEYWRHKMSFFISTSEVAVF